MTRDDAIHIVDVAFDIPLAVRRAGEDRTYQADEIRKAKDMAIKALSQEQQSEWERDHEVLKAYADGQESMKPCEDAISRQAAIDCLDGDITLSDNAYMNAYIIKGYIQATINAIKQLPSVSVLEKTGRWKRISIDKYSEHSKYWYRCNRCGNDNLGNTNWCPNCGAKMGVEE